MGGYLNDLEFKEVKIIIMYLLTFILSALIVSNDLSAEQIAFDYFVTKVLTQNYPEKNKIYFSGQTQRKKSIGGPFFNCFKTDSAFSQFYYQHYSDVESDQIIIDSSNFPKVKKSTKMKGNQLNLEIYRSVNKYGIAYVYIMVYQPRYFADHYLMKISISNQEVIDVCRVNEIM